MITVGPLLSEMSRNMENISDMRGLRIQGLDSLCPFSADKIPVFLRIIPHYVNSGYISSFDKYDSLFMTLIQQSDSLASPSIDRQFTGQYPIWIHGSSLGDVNALRALVHALALRGHPITVSAATRSGKARWQQLLTSSFFQSDQLTLASAPLLSRSAAQRAQQNSQAQLLILELLEIWPTWVKTWHQQGVKIVVVDGRVSKRTLWAKPFLHSSFSKLALFLAQSPQDVVHAVKMGCQAETVHLVGDAKLDSLMLEDKSNENNILSNITDGFNLVVGCFRSQDEKPMLHALQNYRQQRPNDKILLAPRQLERVRPFIKLAQKRGLGIRAFDSVTELQSVQENILILNAYGFLSQLYQVAHCAIIGGTFYHRGQNLLEAALGGCAVIYGPRIKQHNTQSKALLHRGGYQVQSWDDAFQCALTLQSQPKDEVGVAQDVLTELEQVVNQQLKMIDDLIFAP